MDLSNSSAIITGGGSGLGEACARHLASLGAKCIVVDLNEEKGQAVAADIGGQFVKADVSNTEQVQAAVDAAAVGETVVVYPGVHFENISIGYCNKEAILYNL